ILQTVVTESAFMRHVIAEIIACNHPEWAGNHAVGAPVANILLHVDRIKFSANNRSRRARFQAGRVGTVLAHIALHQPAISIEKRQGSPGRDERNDASAFRLTDLCIYIMSQGTAPIARSNLFDELYMSPRPGA